MIHTVDSECSICVFSIKLLRLGHVKSTVKNLERLLMSGARSSRALAPNMRLETPNTQLFVSASRAVATLLKTLTSASRTTTTMSYPPGMPPPPPGMPMSLPPGMPPPPPGMPMSSPGQASSSRMPPEVLAQKSQKWVQMQKKRYGEKRKGGFVDMGKQVCARFCIVLRVGRLLIWRLGVGLAS